MFWFWFSARLVWSKGVEKEEKKVIVLVNFYEKFLLTIRFWLSHESFDKNIRYKVYEKCGGSFSGHRLPLDASIEISSALSTHHRHRFVSYHTAFLAPTIRIQREHR